MVKFTTEGIETNGKIYGIFYCLDTKNMEVSISNIGFKNIPKKVLSEAGIPKTRVIGKDHPDYKMIAGFAAKETIDRLEREIKALGVFGLECLERKEEIKLIEEFEKNI